ncbi:hypothetical protein J1614_005309 [Plenodomus biglobosus]|nr:hypothetical protein J1614_005309 [Plenodomus biglobosus]
MIARTAAPIVYQILLHYSAWPFKPDDTTTITLDGLAIAIALLTGQDQFYICFEDRHSRSYAVERPRNWADRGRLLFQSLCSNTNWAEEATQNCRAGGDDEDLVAVLYESMPQRQKPNRERFLPVAATLPSSHATKVAREVPIQSVQVLLELLLVSATLQLPSLSVDRQEGLYNTARTIACSPQADSTNVDWEQFTEFASNAAVRYSFTAVTSTTLTE